MINNFDKALPAIIEVLNKGQIVCIISIYIWYYNVYGIPEHSNS